MWSVCVLRNLEFFNIFKSSRFSNSDFFKAPVPARSNKTFPANYFFKNLLFPPEVGCEMEMVGHFFLMVGCYQTHVFPG